MKRKDFITIIKLRSFWAIDRKRGNYTLPSGERLFSYIDDLVRGQMDLDRICITASGDLESRAMSGLDEAGLPIYTALIPFGKNEVISFDESERRIKKIINEIIHS